MKKFEYLSDFDLSRKQLDELGEQGWELSALAGRGSCTHWCYFKREIFTQKN